MDVVSTTRNADEQAARERFRASRIFVAGHRGLLGSALVRALCRDGCVDVRTAERGAVDLREQSAVRGWFDRERPEVVFLAAGRVGGIAANAARPAEFAYDNLLIQANVIDAAWRAGARQVVFFASSCMYPKLCPQPMREEHLATGPVEPTNVAYAAAKHAGLETLRAYARQYGLGAVCLLPANLYGPGDNFDPEAGHVIPALLGRFHAAKLARAESVTLWGTGSPEREFLHADDCAEAAVWLSARFASLDVTNVGGGEACTIAQLAEAVRDVVGYEGRVEFDTSRPDGMPRKHLDSSRLQALGWRPARALRDGLAQTYHWMLDSGVAARG